ncbi:hypothetical protein TRIUR3_28931 [Triticum urartu]|uniref:Uncharacterized protein n=1 Tax=Triticum urartu TaxID=4572 RepID=M8AK28_TRIUA|nr:hypothetical protein TRIUR3_28931 [Triticum urartu]
MAILDMPPPRIPLLSPSSLPTLMDQILLRSTTTEVQIHGSCSPSVPSKSSHPNPCQIPAVGVSMMAQQRRAEEIEEGWAVVTRWLEVKQRR